VAAHSGSRCLPDPAPLAVITIVVDVALGSPIATFVRRDGPVADRADDIVVAGSTVTQQAHLSPVVAHDAPEPVSPFSFDLSEPEDVISASVPTHLGRTLTGPVQVLAVPVARQFMNIHPGLLSGGDGRWRPALTVLTTTSRVATNSSDPGWSRPRRGAMPLTRVRAEHSQTRTRIHQGGG
jgi:hypothetical protein